MEPMKPGLSYADNFNRMTLRILFFFILPKSLTFDYNLI